MNDINNIFIIFVQYIQCLNNSTLLQNVNTYILIYISYLNLHIINNYII